MNTKTMWRWVLCAVAVLCFGLAPPRTVAFAADTGLSYEAEALVRDVRFFLEQEFFRELTFEEKRRFDAISELQSPTDYDVYWALREALAALEENPRSTVLNPEETGRLRMQFEASIAGIGITIGPHPDAWPQITQLLMEFMEAHRANGRQFNDLTLTRYEAAVFDRLQEMIFTVTDLGLMVFSVIPGSPAEQTGIQEGWVIQKVDGKLLMGMRLDDVVKLIRGHAGTSVVLSVESLDGGLKDVAVMRSSIDVPMVESRYLGNGIGYVRILSFLGLVHSQFSASIEQLRDEGMTKVVVDVRGNGGGSLEGVRSILNDLVPTPLLLLRVYERYNSHEYRSEPSAKIFQGPMVVLTDGFSASASEIFVGALADHDLAVVVGEKTYGKGTVQSYKFLPRDWTLYFTTGIFELPSGKRVELNGIEPDIAAVDELGTTLVDEALWEAVNVLSRWPTWLPFYYRDHERSRSNFD